MHIFYEFQVILIKSKIDAPIFKVTFMQSFWIFLELYNFFFLI